MAESRTPTAQNYPLWHQASHAVILMARKLKGICCTGNFLSHGSPRFPWVEGRPTAGVVRQVQAGRENKLPQSKVHVGQPKESDNPCCFVHPSPPSGCPPKAPHLGAKAHRPSAPVQND